MSTNYIYKITLLTPCAICNKKRVEYVNYRTTTDITLLDADYLMDYEEGYLKQHEEEFEYTKEYVRTHIWNDIAKALKEQIGLELTTKELLDNNYIRLWSKILTIDSEHAVVRIKAFINTTSKSLCSTCTTHANGIYTLEQYYASSSIPKDVLYKARRYYSVNNRMHSECTCEQCGYTESDEYEVNDFLKNAKISIKTFTEGYKRIEILEFKVMSGELTLTTLEHRSSSIEQCKYCLAKEYIEFKAINKPNGFDGMILSHGLSAFNTIRLDYSSILDRLNDVVCNPDWEICCSNNGSKLGPIGIDVTGTNTYVCSRDACSSVIEEFNIRVPERFVSYHICERKDYCVKGSHSEHFVKNVKIKAIWVKDWALSDITEAELDMLAYDFNTTWYICNSYEKQA